MFQNPMVARTFYSSKLQEEPILFLSTKTSKTSVKLSRVHSCLECLVGYIITRKYMDDYLQSMFKSLLLCNSYTCNIYRSPL